jgi:hypothetical protein
VFFSLQRYPEHLGLLCGSKTEAHGALPRAALGASFSMLKPEAGSRHKIVQDLPPWVGDGFSDTQTPFSQSLASFFNS